MPPHKVRDKETGNIITVEMPEGATHEQIIAEARRRSSREPRTTMKLGGTTIESARPDDPRLVKPSVGRYLATGAKNRAGDILATAASAAVPGSGVLPFAERLLASEVGQDIGDVATTGKITPGYGAATQLVGEGAARAVKPLLSVATYHRFAQRTASALMDKLKQLVPAFERFPDGEKGLARIAHVDGQRAVSGEFDTALRDIKPQVTSRPIWLPRDDLRELGLKTNTWRDVPTGRLRNQMEQFGEVSAADAIDKITGVWKRNPALYRRTVNTLTQDLDQVNLGEAYQQAREQYKVGAGFIEFAEKGKFLYSERYDPVKAMQALDKYGKALMRRGMDEVRAIIRGPGERPVEAVKHNPWVQRIEGGLALGAGGAMLGVPHAIGGAAGGLLGGTQLPRTTYKNVPLTPLGRFATEVLPRSGSAEALREGVRDLGIRPKLPQVTVEPSFVADSERRP